MNRERAKEYLVRRISPGENFETLLRFPRYFEIETVNACNARCAMCTISEWAQSRGRMKEALFGRLAEEIIDHASEVRRVSLYRDGEPMLDTRIADKIKLLKDGGVSEIMISSNGSLLTPDRAEELLKAGLDDIIFSVDSLDPEVYASIRIGLDLDTVMENVDAFIKLRDKLNPSTRIRMRMIRQQSNHDHWPEYEKFWAGKLGTNDRIYYNNINNWGGQLSGFNPVSMSYEPSLPCVALFSLMVIFADGQVPYCNVDFNNTRPTGDVNVSSIADLWQGEVINRRRENHLTDNKGHNPMCARCNAWDEPPDTDPVSAEYAELVAIDHSQGQEKE